MQQQQIGDGMDWHGMNDEELRPIFLEDGNEK
jgi:hypothetical protein